MKLYPYSPASASAKALANALGCLRLKHEGRRIGQQVVINWGSSFIERDLGLSIVINTPEAVAKACNKLTTLTLLQQAGVAHPQFTEDRGEAVEWLMDGLVVARTVLNGHSGQGIVIMENGGGLVDAPLYTKYIKKDQEYRIHVFQGEVFFVQRKARKLDVPDDQVNWKVRNLDGGFIFANIDVVAPDDVLNNAISAVNALGLDFGAVDVMTEKGTGKAFVLECNTACGLQGTTLDKYVEQFQRFL